MIDFIVVEYVLSISSVILHTVMHIAHSGFSSSASRTSYLEVQKMKPSEHTHRTKTVMYLFLSAFVHLVMIARIQSLLSASSFSDFGGG